MASKLGANFDKLTWAAGVSNVGDGLMGAAFPLLIASLTRDPLLVAGATFASRLPWFLFALVSGALADRMDRKRVMVVTDALRAVGVGLLAVSVWTGDASVAFLYLIAFGLGIAETFFDTSTEAFTPRLVSREQLSAANGRLQAVEWVGGAFAGPPLGALLFAVAASLPFVVDAGSFIFAAVLVALIPGPHRSERVHHGTLWEDIKEGLGWLWGQHLLRTLVMMAGVINLLTFAIISIFVLYAQDILGVEDVGYGLLLAALGLGGLLGARVAGAARLLAWGTQPIGALLGGALAAAIGLRSVFAMSGLVYAAMIDITWRVTSNQRIRAAEAGGSG